MCLTVRTAIFSLLVFFVSMSQCIAAPRVIRVDLGAAVNVDTYAVVFDNDKSGNGIWINPGSTSGTSVSAIDPPASSDPPSITPAAADMFGDSSGYGQMLFSVSAVSPQILTELSNLTVNCPTNANSTVFSGTTGPVNKVNVDANRAIPSGTTVTFTVDMNGEPPHLVSVLGGSIPTVTYNSGTSILTVSTTTTGTTNEAGEAFQSIAGLMIFTNTTTFGNDPLRIIGQTNHWPGDIFSLLPGFDSNAATSNIGGTSGTTTAKCGLTVYGPSGEQRDINIFFPDASVSSIFGSGATIASLAAYVNSTEDTSATITTGQNNFGVTGTLAQFNFTFASPKDGSVGIETTNPTVTATSPSDGDTNVALNSTVNVTFSEDMDQSTITTSTFSLSGGGSPVAGSVSTTSTTATFTPSANLQDNTTYTVTLTTGVKDLAGNALSGTCTWSFSTGGTVDTTAPTVSSVSPSNGAVTVGVDSSISVTFSESMRSSTINTNTFTLTYSGGTVSGTVTYSGKTATFTPSGNLAFDTQYTATITTGVKDEAGNPLGSNYSWVFTTDKDSDGDGVGDNIDVVPSDNTKASPESSTGTGKITVDVGINTRGTLSGVRAVSDTASEINQAGKPSGYTFTHGLVDFNINDLLNGEKVRVKLTYPSEIKWGSKLYKVGSDGFTEVDCNIVGNSVYYTVTDGGDNDADNTENGSIDDPVGIAEPDEDVPQSTESIGGCFLDSLLR